MTDEAPDGADDVEDEPDVEGLFGSSDEEGEEPMPDEAELFGGSDEDDEDGAADTVPDSRSEISDMDERDIFGDVSDDDPEKELTIELESRQRPPADQELVTMRLPNIISFEEAEYSGFDSITDEMMEGYKEYKNTRGNSALKLMNPENCVRWRYEEDDVGNRTLDDGGKEVCESNTRLVEWEDGSWSLFVGGEAFQIQQMSDRTPIFEENKDVFVCHGSITQKFQAMPKSMDSASHEMLKKSQYRKYEPVRRSLLMTEADTMDAKQALEIQANERKARAKKRPAVEGGPMTAGFLEDDASVHGPSVADIKKQYRSRPAKRRGGPHGCGTSRRADFLAPWEGF